MPVVDCSATTFQATALSGGTAVDLSGFTASTAGSINPINPADAAFVAAGIASIGVDGRASGNNEFYNPGTTFGAGDALFNTEDGELILVEEGTTLDFGSPTFTIDFVGLVDGFGFRIADTSNGFITPIVIEAFRGASSVFTTSFAGAYNAATRFSLTDVLGFDRVIISTDGRDSDGYGITELLVGNSVTGVGPSPVPLPASLWLLIAALGGIFGLRRRVSA